MAMFPPPPMTTAVTVTSVYLEKIFPLHFVALRYVFDQYFPLEVQHKIMTGRVLGRVKVWTLTKNILLPPVKKMNKKPPGKVSGKY